jgi:hypothetical protein
MKKLLNMMRIIVLLLVFVGIEAFGQTEPIPVDTIIKLGNRKIPAFVKQVSVLTVSYSLPSKPDSVIKLELKQLEKIIYRNGRVDIFNKPPIDVVKDSEWESVQITRKKEDVKGLYKYIDVAATSTPNERSDKDAEQSALIKVRKQAAAAKASIIYLTKDRPYGGFSDPQGYRVEGIAYGKNPPEKGTNAVTKDKAPKEKEDKK